MKKHKPKTMLEIMAQTRSRESMGRPVTMLTKRDKLRKRNHQKTAWRKEARQYVG